jgi:hypothetical protein
MDHVLARVACPWLFGMVLRESSGRPARLLGVMGSTPIVSTTGLLMAGRYPELGMARPLSGDPGLNLMDDFFFSSWDSSALEKSNASRKKSPMGKVNSPVHLSNVHSSFVGPDSPCISKGFDHQLMIHSVPALV